MQVVGAADAHIVNMSVAATAHLVEVAVEALRLGEESGIGKIAVHDAHTVERVEGSEEGVAGFFDGFEVAWGDVAGGADEGEVFQNLRI